MGSDLAFAHSISVGSKRLAPYMRKQRETLAHARMESLIKHWNEKTKLGRAAIRQLDLEWATEQRHLFSIREFRSYLVGGHEPGSNERDCPRMNRNEAWSGVIDCGADLQDHHILGAIFQSEEAEVGAAVTQISTSSIGASGGQPGCLPTHLYWFS